MTGSISLFLRTLPVLVLVLVGCGSQSTDQEPPAAAAVPLPANLFTDTAPDAPLSVAEARRSATEGTSIVLRGRIGGRARPFSEERAIFLLSDLSLPPCTDGCPAPWDYCCEDPKAIQDGVATIQVVGQDGKPLATGLERIGGLKPMSEVVVAGTVQRRDDQVLVVNAERIHVAP